MQLNEITFTGYSNTDTSSLFNCVKNQEAETIQGFESLPNNPAIIQGVTLSNANLFYTEIEQQQSNKISECNIKAWQALNDSALYNIKIESFENIDREILSATYVLENVTSQILSIKIKDIENKNVAELVKQKAELVAKLFEMNMKNGLGQLSSPHQIRTTRRDIARLNTALLRKSAR